MWQPRAFLHPALATQTTRLDTQPLRVNARCAILLFYPQLEEVIVPEAEQKILTGMVSVLELLPEQIMLVKIYSHNPDLELIAQQIQSWSPFAVLQLSMGLPKIQVNAHYVRTFSPAHLQQHVQDKGQAYKDLLSLRKILHHVAS